jgi:hemoglobin
MKNLLLLMFILSISSAVFGQYNSSERQLLSLQSMASGLTIGGYGEITYNDPDSGVSEIDVQRLVMLFAYKFDDRVSFITEIEFHPVMYAFFKDSNIDRFSEKISEHICMLTGGPFEYTGENMKQVHADMNISESEFDYGVDLIIVTMTKANIHHTIQNKILAVIIPTRDVMIYL